MVYVRIKKTNEVVEVCACEPNPITIKVEAVFNVRQPFIQYLIEDIELLEIEEKLKNSHYNE